MSSLSEAEAQDLAIKHYEGLRRYLASYLTSRQAAANSSQQREAARTKLTKLSRIQFADMATDVYDEMNRRITDSASMPFLAVRTEFHPKRNQARQKLATLKLLRFKDLTSDIFYEIERRFSIALERYLLRNGMNDGTVGAGTPEAYNIEQRLQQQSQQQQQFYNGGSSSSSSNILDPNMRKFDPPPRPMRRSPSPPPFRGANNFTPIPNDGKGSQQKNSLDNLLAGLGEVLNRPNEQNSFGIRNVSEEYEQKLAALNDQLQAERAENSKLKKRLDEKTLELTDIEASLNGVSNDYRKLKDEYNIIAEENESRQRLIDDIKNEASTLLNDVKTLQQKNDDLVEKVQNLEQELRASKSNSNRNNNPVDSAYKSDYSEINGSAAFRIDSHRINALQDNIDDLMRASKNNSPTSVIQTMKAIVLACRDISEDTDNLQSDMGFKWSQSEISDINYLKDELQESVENLVKACKTLASGDSSLPKTVLENIARKLMNVSRDLVSAVNRAVDFSGGGGSGRGGGGSSSQNNNNFNQMQQRQPLQEAPKQSTAYNNTQSQVTSIYDQNDRSYFSDDYNQRSDNRYTRDTDLSYNDGGGAEPLNIPSLKTHLEAQTDLIVQSIQALLKTMRNSEIFGSELTDIVADITSIVQSLVYSSKQSLGLPTASRIHNDGHLILQDLEYSAQMLETLGASLIIDPSSKSLKQKVATSSYEIAKFIKNLINLLDEC